MGGTPKQAMNHFYLTKLRTMRRNQSVLGVPRTLSTIASISQSNDAKILSKPKESESKYPVLRAFVRSISESGSRPSRYLRNYNVPTLVPGKTVVSRH